MARHRQVGYKPPVWSCSMTGGVAFRALLILLLLPGCAWFRTEAPPPPAALVEIVEDPVPVEWRSVVTEADQDRLGRIDEAWTRGLAAAARFRSMIAAEGPLLDPRTALPRAAPSPGPYLCRVIRLGGRPAFASFKAFNCYVEAEGELLTMVKANGTLRPAGRLWPDTDARMVFLGALSEGDEGPRAYGETAGLDVAGYVERVEPFRWRLVVPFPQGQPQMLDIYELVPLLPPEA